MFGGLVSFSKGRYSLLDCRVMEHYMRLLTNYGESRSFANQEKCNSLNSVHSLPLICENAIEQTYPILRFLNYRSISNR